MKYVMFPHAGSQNRGCEAIVRTTVAMLEKDADDLLLYSANPVSDRAVCLNELAKVIPFGAASIKKGLPKMLLRIRAKLRRDDPDNLFYYRKHRVFRHADVALSIGGDNYCYQGMIYMLQEQCLVSDHFSIPRILWSCSLDEKLLTPELIEHLKKYRAIFVRESVSQQILLKAGIRENVFLYPDPAFTLQPQETSFRIQNGNPFIGLNISPLMGRFGSAELLLQNYECLIRKILKETDRNIALIPHVFQEGNSDLECMRPLLEKFPKERVELVDQNCNCMQLKSLISQCEFFVGCRTHATIAAYSTGVPTLVVGYSNKSRGIARDIFGTEKGYVLPITELKSEKDLTMAFEALYRQKDSIREELQTRMKTYIIRAFEAGEKIKEFLPQKRKSLVERIIKKIKNAFLTAGYYICKSFSTIGRLFKKMIAAVRCVYALLKSKKNTANESDYKNEFNTFLPDKGKLDIHSGFLNPVSLDLSIIIAAYNAEEYIDECLTSVLQQNTRYCFEVLIVNDGSTDQTKERIRKYMADGRIRYYEQQHAGQSVARNFAIQNSCGRYIMILDSDDFICKGSIDCLMELAAKTRSDIIEGGIQRFSGNTRPIEPRKIKIQTFSGKQKSKYILRSVGYSVAKLYKRELWDTVRYPIGYIFEDVISKFVLRRLATQITITNHIVYMYRQNPHSTSHGSDHRKRLDSLLVFPKIVQICQQNNLPMDRTFYLLSLNHIGLLNHITTAYLGEQDRKLCFCNLQKQLHSIQCNEKKKLPFWFALLEKSILNGNYEAWLLIASTIQKYTLISHYREIN